MEIKGTHSILSTFFIVNQKLFRIHTYQGVFQGGRLGVGLRRPSSEIALRAILDRDDNALTNDNQQCTHAQHVRCVITRGFPHGLCVGYVRYIPIQHNRSASDLIGLVLSLLDCRS